MLPPRAVCSAAGRTAATGHRAQHDAAERAAPVGSDDHELGPRGQPDRGTHRAVPGDQPNQLERPGGDAPSAVTAAPRECAAKVHAAAYFRFEDGLIPRIEEYADFVPGNHDA